MSQSHRRKMSRRTILTTSIGGAAAAAVGAFAVTKAATASTAPQAAAAAAQVGDVVGKVTVGYQGWFACSGDGAPINGWWHWSTSMSQPPSPSNNSIKAWPDMTDYGKSYRTAYGALGNGSPAALFSSYDQQTVDTHFLWMQQNGIDTAALQRFNPVGGEGPTRDAMATKVRSAAEAHGRKFYIMYDVSGWSTMQSEIKADWTNKMKAHTASAAYAVQNGKPVVCIWGFGFNDSKHAFDAAACLDVVNWFKGQGCYVIGGVPREWRTGVNGSRAGFSDVYHAFDMLSPWMVGAIGNAADSDSTYQNVNVPDQADCNAHGIAYQPCVLPGDLSARQRAHGDFMWRQFYNMVRLGAQGIYISMFDEYNEGNQIAKTTPTQATVPTGSGLLSLDEDGTACSSDYYLRLTGDGGRMLKGQIALTATRPTPPVVSAPRVVRTVSLRAVANNDYVTAENAGASPLIANRTAVGGWEQFDVVDAGGGNIALRAKANGRYVCADNAGASPLIANRTAFGPWETFKPVTNANGTISLLAQVNGKYVTAENGGASPLVANRASIGAWEQFTQTTV
ncbi:glycoside hydrolase family 71/99-like protein [Kitasatospora sp. NPDC049285]|uniref:glycoside hydrolase family 71/99-like protein n=1 Tax=Kitasatospora sp. NPDC049285 TaxID=3157096 RepID=UPI0034399FA0